MKKLYLGATLAAVILSYSLVLDGSPSPVDTKLANQKLKRWISESKISKVLDFEGLEFDAASDKYILTLHAIDPLGGGETARDSSQYLRSYYFRQQGTRSETKIRSKASLFLGVATRDIDVVIYEFESDLSHMLRFDQEFLEKMFPNTKELASDAQAAVFSTVDLGKVGAAVVEELFSRHGCDWDVLQQSASSFEAMGRNCQKMVIKAGPERWEKLHLTSFVLEDFDEDKSKRTLTLMVDGEYAAGLARDPSPEHYVDMEPKYAEDLTIFARKLLNKLTSKLSNQEPANHE